MNIYLMKHHSKLLAVSLALCLFAVSVLNATAARRGSGTPPPPPPSGGGELVSAE